MPAKVLNDISIGPDGTTALSIVAGEGRGIRLLVDDCFAVFLYQHTWLWDKALQRCYAYSGGKKVYLSTFIAEHARRGAEARHVRFKNGPLDYRLESLDIRYGELLHVQQG